MFAAAADAPCTDRAALLLDGHTLNSMHALSLEPTSKLCENGQVQTCKVVEIHAS